MSINVSQLMAGYDPERAHKIRECGTYLAFCQTTNGLKLHGANFCRERLCPMCQWRRSIKLRVQADKIYKVLAERGYKHIFATLTVKNCKADELGITITRLIESCQRLQKRDFWRAAVKGSYRALEITYNDERDDYHPHLHYLLTVPGDYFRSENPDYITKDMLIEHWRESARLDYNPAVDIEAVTQKEGQSITSACAEVCKYPAKTAEIKSPAVLETIDYALRGRRLIQWGGVTAEVRRELELDDVEKGNLIQVDGETPEDVPLQKVVYIWRYGFYIPLDYQMIDEKISG